MKICIAGGSGFIGRNITETLSSKYTLLTPSHKELELLDEKEVENYFKKHKVDIVIYCSNIGGTRNTATTANVASTNIRMFFNIARCKKMYKRMIFLGSGAEYGKDRPIINIREKSFDQRVPKDEYGFSKYIISKYIQQTDNIVNLRLFGVYGKYEDYSLRFISYAICRNIMGLPILIDQNVFFDYLYIKDLIKIIDFFIENKPDEKFFNVGRGEKIDLLTIAEAVNKISEKQTEIAIKKVGFKNEYTCDTTLLKNTIKDLQFTDFDESLRELYSYYKSVYKSLNLSGLQ